MELEIRPTQEIQKDANQLMFKIGALEVEISYKEAEVRSAFDKLRELNVEMLAAKAHEAKLLAELEQKKNEKPQG